MNSVHLPDLLALQRDCLPAIRRIARQYGQLQEDVIGDFNELYVAKLGSYDPTRGASVKTFLLNQLEHFQRRRSLEIPRGALSLDSNEGVALYGGCPEFCVNGVGLKVGHPLYKLDSKAIERRFPIANRHRPFLTDIS